MSTVATRPLELAGLDGRTLWLLAALGTLAVGS